MNSNRRARHIALQALYEIDCSNHSPAAVITRRIEWERQATKPPSKSVEAMVERLVYGVLGAGDKLDSLIREYAPEWPLDQMAVIDRNVLRIALYEIIASKNTPTKIAINEAVELAKAFGGDNAPRFVNGVLGTVAARKTELVANFNAIVGGNEA